MTMTLAPQSLSAPTTTWASPVSGLWTSSRRGEYLGFVERSSDESSGAMFLAIGARGEQLGWFDELAAAKEAVARGGAA